MSASSKRISLAAFAAVALVTTTSATRVAHADGAALDCPSSSEAGQRLRDKNKYADARAMFRACSQTTCPAIVRRDCAKWLNELDETQPSIVIAAQDATGADLAAVKVLIDEHQVASKVDGSPIAIDPGEHSLRVEAPGHAPLTQRLIVRVSERNRLVRVVFQDGDKPPAAATTPVGPPRATTETPAMTQPAKSGAPVLAIVLTGVGIVALGSFGYFGLTSKSDLSKLRSDCAPFCDQAQLDDVKSRMLIADVSLGVGIVALGVAAVLFVTHGSGKSAVTTASR